MAIHRDGKKGKKQIVIGLLTARDGEPLSVEVFKGNTGDSATVGAQIGKLAARFKVQEAIFVEGRRMIKTKGKAQLDEVHFRYLTALTDPEVRKPIKADVIQPDLFDEQVVEVTHGGKRLVLRCDPATQRKERHRREDKLQRLAERNAFGCKSLSVF